MFDFAYPYLLILLVLVPALWLLYKLSVAVKRKRLRRFGNSSVIAHLMPDASPYKPALKITLQLIALFAVIIILARPRYGEHEVTESRDGIEVVIAFDVSRSMLAASTDDPHSTSRLQRAKLLLEKLIDRLGNDRVALVVFAGDARTKLPLTNDFYSAKLMLGDLDPLDYSNQGTSIGEAIEMSMKRFSDTEDVHKAIILITDAEDNEGNGIEAAKIAAERDIQVDVVGVGTSTGAPIVINGENLKDKDGNTVMTKVDPEVAKDIAQAGKGIYVNGSAADALDKLSETLDTLGKSKLNNVNYKVSAEQFPLFAWIALILLIIDIFVVERKIGWLKNVSVFGQRTIDKIKVKQTSTHTNPAKNTASAKQNHKQVNDSKKGGRK